jgi:hypothetical protein
MLRREWGGHTQMIHDAPGAMTVFQLYEWCLYPRREGVCGDAAIREAVARRSATMTFGAHLFAYRDEELPEGGHLLSLTPLPGQFEEDVLDGHTVERRVPPALPQWDEESKWRLVLVMGHVLFEDTARLMTVNVRLK